jgi:antitoxin MazE
MKLQAKIQKWGNGLALRIAGAMREVPDFKEGTPVEIEVSKDGFSVKKAATTVSSFKLPFSEADLLSGLIPAWRMRMNWRY